MATAKYEDMIVFSSLSIDILINMNVLLLGALDFPNVPKAGDAIKNRYLLDFFQKNFDDVKYVDTQKWRKNPIILVSILYYLLFRKIDNIVVSASNQSAYRMICLLDKLKLKHSKTFYFMIGGYTPIKIKKGIYSAEPFKSLERIIVEADRVKDFYHEVGLDNTYRVYNFKPTSFCADVTTPHEGKFRFVFLSRLTEQKGIFHILESTRQLNESGYQNRFSVDFYGRIDSDVEKQFLKEVDSIENANYCGFLNLNEEGNYEVLAQYDAMLFPTMHPTEGFPGVIADAAIAGVPVIASNWNYAKELVEDCGCGYVFPVGDNDALTQEMEKAILNRKGLQAMRAQCVRRSQEYRVENILTRDLIDGIGMKK